jgi:hypothetical protein
MSHKEMCSAVSERHVVSSSYVYIVHIKELTVANTKYASNRHVIWLANRSCSVEPNKRNNNQRWKLQDEPNTANHHQKETGIDAAFHNPGVTQPQRL